MNRRALVVGATGGLSLYLAGCLSGDPGASNDGYDVGMRASSFEPARLEVSVGESVVWRNTNSRSHTITAYERQLPEGADYFASGGYDSERAARDAFWNSFGGVLTTGQEFEHTFTVAGQYDYFCVPHEKAGMVGTVVVRE